MGEIICFDFEKFKRGQYPRISLGFKPSGKLHIGSVLTLIQGFLYVQSNPGSSLEVNVMDLDYDNQCGHRFDSLYFARDTETGELAKDITARELRRISDDITEVLGLASNPVHIMMFSDNLGFGSELLGIIRRMAYDRELTRATKRAIFDGRANSYTVPLTGVCPECHTSNTSPGVLVNDRKAIRSECKNGACEVDSYISEISEIGTYNIHYLVDPVRDICVEDLPGIGAHLFGGDYALPNGTSRIMKADRVMRIMQLYANGSVLPDIYVGPLLTLDGTKMSKSYGAVSIFELENRHDWIKRLIELGSSGACEIKHKDIIPVNQP